MSRYDEVFHPHNIATGKCLGGAVINRIVAEKRALTEQFFTGGSVGQRLAERARQDANLELRLAVVKFNELVLKPQIGRVKRNIRSLRHR